VVLAVGGGVVDAVGVWMGRVGIAAGVAALLPAAPVGELGGITVTGSPELSLPPHAARMAATPKHVAIRDLIGASNIELGQNKMRVVR
jgi:hypothetical protein